MKEQKKQSFAVRWRWILLVITGFILYKDLNIDVWDWMGNASALLLFIGLQIRSDHGPELTGKWKFWNKVCVWTSIGLLFASFYIPFTIAIFNAALTPPA